MKTSLLFIFIALAATTCYAEEELNDWDPRVIEGVAKKWDGSAVVDQIRSYALMPEILKIIETSESVTLFEGMPHQFQEKELLEKELEKYEELKIWGFCFYPEPRQLSDADKSKLDKLLDHAKGLGIYRGPKLCGGFHPDYAIRFKKDDKTCDLLLCFGCGEARIHFDGKLIYTGLETKEWINLLTGYAKLRPAKTAATVPDEK